MSRIETLVGGAALALGGSALIARALRHKKFDLDGKRVVVAGGSRGLGLELAREYARRGAHVGLLARDPEKLESAAYEVEDAAKGSGQAVLTRSVDLRDADATETAIDELATELGGIDVLVNLAGTITVGPMRPLRLEDFRAQMDSNFYTSLHATLAALPHLRRSRGARIVNITSIGGRFAVPHLLPYSAAKFAMVGFSTGLRAELAREGITVTTVTPGLMRTGSPFHANFKGQREREFRWFLLMDSLPGLSISSRKAAKQIVDASVRGDASLVVPAYLRIPIALTGIAPGFVNRVTTAANALLPSPASEGDTSQSGRELIPPERTPTYATLTRRAAQRNNQF